MNTDSHRWKPFIICVHQNPSVANSRVAAWGVAGVAASPSVNDFAHVEKEDGESHSDWAVYDSDPAGATVTSVTDSARHPDGIQRVIYCDGGNGNGFAVGDKDGSNYNPNGNSWNDTRRVLSFWFKGGFSPVYVCVSTSAGSRFLCYYTGSGTDFVDVNGNVNVYLGWSAGGTTWRRFERDVAADWARVTSGASTWTNTDGFLVRPTSHASYDIWFDDLRLSNARTVTHNSLTGGAIGQITSSREVTSAGGNGSLGLTDTWYHYDHIGNVMNFSNTSGALVAGSIQHQDAWGNVLSSSTTGAWATMTDGRHLTTKEYDADAGMYYFWQRWYNGQVGVFLGLDPVDSWLFEHNAFSAYNYCYSSPTGWHDADGEKPSKGRYKPRRPGRPQPVMKPGPGKPTVMDPKKIAKKSGKFARGCMKAFRAVTCTSCSAGLGIVEGICAVYTHSNAAWLDCLCDQINNNAALRLSCNGCSVPLIGLDPIDGFTYCDDE